MRAGTGWVLVLFGLLASVHALKTKADVEREERNRVRKEAKKRHKGVNPREVDEAMSGERLRDHLNSNLLDPEDEEDIDQTQQMMVEAEDLGRLAGEDAESYRQHLDSYTKRRKELNREKRDLIKRQGQISREEHEREKQVLKEEMRKNEKEHAAFVSDLHQKRRPDQLYEGNRRDPAAPLGGKDGVEQMRQRIRDSRQEATLKRLNKMWEMAMSAGYDAIELAEVRSEIDEFKELETSTLSVIADIEASTTYNPEGLDAVLPNKIEEALDPVKKEERRQKSNALRHSRRRQMLLEKQIKARIKENQKEL